jgi:hypothetical protein
MNATMDKTLRGWLVTLPELIFWNGLDEDEDEDKRGTGGG